VAGTPNDLIDYLADLNVATSAEDCLAATQRHVRRRGYQNVVLGYTRRPQRIDGDLPRYLRYSTVSKVWENRYREMEYQNHCPIYRESLRGGHLPIIWQDVLDRTELNAMARQAQDEAVSAGLSHGVSVRIKEPNGDRCAIGISTNAGKLDAKKMTDAYLPLVFLMSHHLHAVIVEKFVNQGMHETTAPLTVSEGECLQWLAAGKGNWEISEICGISENTVKFHVRNVLVKLGVTNRAAAVAKAFRLGLIEL
jgi:DNA-binding CsgD family transcriptional regulator